jgi:tetratricopeptide (TPR) repeat protein
VHTDGVEARYRLLEMVRQFALNQLIAASEASSARDRHAEYYLRRFEIAAADLLGPREPETVAALDLELDNLLAALHQIGSRAEGVPRVLRAVSDGWLFWVSRGRIAVARGVLASAIQQTPDSITPAAARALMASSMFARFAGDSTQALGDAERSVALYRRLDRPDPSGLAFALFQRAGAAISFTPERAMPRQDLESGIELSIAANDEVMKGICLNMLSGLDLADGSIEAAEARLVEALSTARTTQSPYLLILYLANLASVRVDRGRWLESVALEREAIDLVQRSGNRHFAPLCVLVAARILAASGDLSSAYHLSGAAFGMWATVGERPAVHDTEWLDRLSVPADDSRREEYARLKEEGRTLAFDAAIAEALRALQQCSQS